MESSINKNSSNSRISTSKVIKKIKTGTNIYNHKRKGSNKNGGQYEHKSETLTKEKLQAKIGDNNISVK